MADRRNFPATLVVAGAATAVMLAAFVKNISWGRHADGGGEKDSANANVPADGGGAAAAGVSRQHSTSGGSLDTSADGGDGGTSLGRRQSSAGCFSESAAAAAEAERARRREAAEDAELFLRARGAEAEARELHAFYGSFPSMYYQRLSALRVQPIRSGRPPLAGGPLRQQQQQQPTPQPPQSAAMAMANTVGAFFGRVTSSSAKVSRSVSGADISGADGGDYNGGWTDERGDSPNSGNSPRRSPSGGTRRPPCHGWDHRNRECFCGGRPHRISGQGTAVVADHSTAAGEASPDFACCDCCKFAALPPPQPLPLDNCASSSSKNSAEPASTAAASLLDVMWVDRYLGVRIPFCSSHMALVHEERHGRTVMLRFIVSRDAAHAMGGGPAANDAPFSLSPDYCPPAPAVGNYWARAQAKAKAKAVADGVDFCATDGERRLSEPPVASHRSMGLVPNLSLARLLPTGFGANTVSPSLSAQNSRKHSRAVTPSRQLSTASGGFGGFAHRSPSNNSNSGPIRPPSAPSSGDASAAAGGRHHRTASSASGISSSAIPNANGARGGHHDGHGGLNLPSCLLGPNGLPFVFDPSIPLFSSAVCVEIFITVPAATVPQEAPTTHSSSCVDSSAGRCGATSNAVSGDPSGLNDDTSVSDQMPVNTAGTKLGTASALKSIAPFQFSMRRPSTVSCRAQKEYVASYATVAAADLVAASGDATVPTAPLPCVSGDQSASPGGTTCIPMDHAETIESPSHNSPFSGGSPSHNSPPFSGGSPPNTNGQYHHMSDGYAAAAAAPPPLSGSDIVALGLPIDDAAFMPRLEYSYVAEKPLSLELDAAEGNPPNASALASGTSPVTEGAGSRQAYPRGYGESEGGYGGAVGTPPQSALAAGLVVGGRPPVSSEGSYGLNRRHQPSASFGLAGLSSGFVGTHTDAANHHAEEPNPPAPATHQQFRQVTSLFRNGNGAEVVVSLDVPGPRIAALPQWFLRVARGVDFSAGGKMQNAFVQIPLVEVTTTTTTTTTTVATASAAEATSSSHQSTAVFSAAPNTNNSAAHTTNTITNTIATASSRDASTFVTFHTLSSNLDSGIFGAGLGGEHHSSSIRAERVASSRSAPPPPPLLPPTAAVGDAAAGTYNAQTNTVRGLDLSAAAAAQQQLTAAATMPTPTLTSTSTGGASSRGGAPEGCGGGSVSVGGGSAQTASPSPPLGAGSEEPPLPPLPTDEPTPAYIDVTATTTVTTSHSRSVEPLSITSMWARQQQQQQHLCPLHHKDGSSADPTEQPLSIGQMEAMSAGLRQYDAVLETSVAGDAPLTLDPTASYLFCSEPLHGFSFCLPPGFQRVADPKIVRLMPNAGVSSIAAEQQQQPSAQGATATSVRIDVGPQARRGKTGRPQRDRDGEGTAAGTNAGSPNGTASVHFAPSAAPQSSRKQQSAAGPSGAHPLGSAPAASSSAASAVALSAAIAEAVGEDAFEEWCSPENAASCFFFEGLTQLGGATASPAPRPRVTKISAVYSSDAHSNSRQGNAAASASTLLAVGGRFTTVPVPNSEAETKAQLDGGAGMVLGVPATTTSVSDTALAEALCAAEETMVSPHIASNANSGFSVGAATGHHHPLASTSSAPSALDAPSPQPNADSVSVATIAASQNAERRPQPTPSAAVADAAAEWAMAGGAAAARTGSGQRQGNGDGVQLFDTLQQPIGGGLLLAGSCGQQSSASGAAAIVRENHALDLGSAAYAAVIGSRPPTSLAGARSANSVPFLTLKCEFTSVTQLPPPHSQQPVAAPSANTQPLIKKGGKGAADQKGSSSGAPSKTAGTAARQHSPPAPSGTLRPADLLAKIVDGMGKKKPNADTPTAEAEACGGDEGNAERGGEGSPLTATVSHEHTTAHSYVAPDFTNTQVDHNRLMVVARYERYPQARYGWDAVIPKVLQKTAGRFRLYESAIPFFFERPRGGGQNTASGGGTADEASNEKIEMRAFEAAPAYPKPHGAPRHGGLLHRHTAAAPVPATAGNTATPAAEADGENSALAGAAKGRTANGGALEAIADLTSATISSLLKPSANNRIAGGGSASPIRPAANATSTSNSVVKRKGAAPEAKKGAAESPTVPPYTLCPPPAPPSAEEAVAIEAALQRTTAEEVAMRTNAALRSFPGALCVAPDDSSPAASPPSVLGHHHGAAGVDPSKVNSGFFFPDLIAVQQSQAAAQPLRGYFGALEVTMRPPKRLHLPRPPTPPTDATPLLCPLCGAPAHAAAASATPSPLPRTNSSNVHSANSFYSIGGTQQQQQHTPHGHDSPTPLGPIGATAVVSSSSLAPHNNNIPTAAPSRAGTTPAGPLSLTPSLSRNVTLQQQQQQHQHQQWCPHPCHHTTAEAAVATQQPQQPPPFAVPDDDGVGTLTTDGCIKGLLCVYIIAVGGEYLSVSFLAKKTATFRMRTLLELTSFAMSGAARGHHLGQSPMVHYVQLRHGAPHPLALAVPPGARVMEPRIGDPIAVFSLLPELFGSRFLGPRPAPHFSSPALAHAVLRALPCHPAVSAPSKKTRTKALGIFKREVIGLIHALGATFATLEVVAADADGEHPEALVAADGGPDGGSSFAAADGASDQRHITAVHETNSADGEGHVTIVELADLPPRPRARVMGTTGPSGAITSFYFVYHRTIAHHSSCGGGGQQGIGFGSGISGNASASAYNDYHQSGGGGGGFNNNTNGTFIDISGHSVAVSAQQQSHYSSGYPQLQGGANPYGSGSPEPLRSNGSNHPHQIIDSRYAAAPSVTSAGAASRSLHGGGGPPHSVAASSSSKVLTRPILSLAESLPPAAVAAIASGSAAQPPPMSGASQSLYTPSVTALSGARSTATSNGHSPTTVLSGYPATAAEGGFVAASSSSSSVPLDTFSSAMACQFNPFKESGEGAGSGSGGSSRPAYLGDSSAGLLSRHPLFTAYQRELLSSLHKAEGSASSHSEQRQQHPLAALLGPAGASHAELVGESSGRSVSSAAHTTVRTVAVVMCVEGCAYVLQASTASRREFGALRRAVLDLAQSLLI